MQHWTDPEHRGLYNHPSASPPPPAHHNQNDVSSRLARVEEHLNFGAWNLRRVETESRMRATDLINGLAELGRRLAPIERRIHSDMQSRKATRRIGTSLMSWLKYLIAGILTLLMLTGKASIEHVKIILGVFGFPGG